MPPLLLKLIFDRIPTMPMPFFVKPIARGISEKVLARMVTPNLTRQLDFMEKELAANAWFAGAEFSAADIQMSFRSKPRPSAPGSTRAGRTWRVPEAHSRAAGLPQGARARRTVQLRQRLTERN
jgi:glutathione S-transferase